MPKIVQTFWSGNQSADTYLFNNGGWLSAEYHWMAWALSCLQIRQFYPLLELVTDAVGEAFFRDTLALPYTNIIPALDVLNQYDKRLWALAKIYSYSLQNEPFIHMDGDVFIWKKLNQNLEQAELIAQNFEVDFPFYQSPLRIIERHFKDVPACMLKELENNTVIYSCNMGITGGYNLDIFKEYKDLAFRFITANETNLSKVEINHVNICVEQFLYYALSKSKGITPTYLVEKEFDPTYPNYADFHEVPHQTWYIHAMAEYKCKPEVCHHLARRLRKDFPEYYYRIIDLCLNQGIKLDWQCYPLNRLNEQWKTFYEKDKEAYQTVERLYEQATESLLETQLQFSKDCRIEEIENPEYSQTIHYPDITRVCYTSQILDSLNIVLLDAFQEPISINQGIETVKPYFDLKEIDKNPAVFQSLILSRVKDWLFLGVLEVDNV
jgi:hypothetical protein